MLMSKDVNNDVMMNPPINARYLLPIGFVAQLVSAGRSNSEIARGQKLFFDSWFIFLSFQEHAVKKKKGVNFWELTGITAVSDNTRPALSKTFQDLGFFFDVNQTVTIASNPCLLNKGSNSVLK